MSMSTILKEKAVEAYGKASLVVAPASEVGKQTGMFDNVTLIQIISAIGVVSLILDRTINSINSVSDKPMKNKIFTYSLWGALWLSSLMVLLVAI